MEEPMNLPVRRFTRQKAAEAIAKASPPLNQRLRNAKVKGKGERNYIISTVLLICSTNIE